jgi:hypothetical protein
MERRAQREAAAVNRERETRETPQPRE